MLKAVVPPVGGWLVDDAEEACCSPMAPLTTCRLQQCQPSSPLRLPQPAFSAGGRRVRRETPVQRTLFAQDTYVSLPRRRLPPALVLDSSEPASMAGVVPTSSSSSSARFPAAPGGCSVEAWLAEMGGRSAGCKALEAAQTVQEEHAEASVEATTAALPPPAFVLMGLLN